MPPKKRALHPLPLFDAHEVLEFLYENDIKETHVHALWSQLIRYPEKEIKDIPNLPQLMYDEMPTKFARLTSTLISQHSSENTTTVKLVIRLQDGHNIESVIIKHAQRATLCVSSQVGCQMGCTFCATGTMGLLANLYCGEIIEQLVIANAIHPIRNVVFMGMGEPLQNYPAVLAAVRMMVDSRLFGLSPTHVTVSTVGVIPYIRKMTQDIPNVNLALSLHAPTQELREKIVPSAAQFKLDRLMESISDHQKETGKRILIEYILISEVNDRQEHATLLGNLLKDLDAHVNLIPYNPTPTNPEFKAPLTDDVRAFHRILFENFKIPTTTRTAMGQDVEGACGQLVLAQSKKDSSGDSGGCSSGTGKASGVPDVEDLVPSKKSSNSAVSIVRKRKNAPESSRTSESPEEVAEIVLPEGQDINWPNLISRFLRILRFLLPFAIALVVTLAFTGDIMI